ncbi:MAG: hypothetical protein QOE70_1414 [Chthoniobacter sp.]|jgi:hypothetical protein|nr:hypothetical protein [Chthoniobacter sp.]
MRVAKTTWIGRSYAFVTLWSRPAADAVLDWLASAEVPPQSFLYWVDNSGGKLAPRLGSTWGRLRSRFRGLVLLSAGDPYQARRGEPYLTLARHAHVTALYNQVFSRVREEMVVTLEDDIRPPRDGLRKLVELMQGDVALASGVYRSRRNPDYICASRDKAAWHDVPRFDALPAKPFEVGMTGGGFALIENRALQAALPLRCSTTPDGGLMAWDGNLALDLAAAGARLLAHPQVRCEHLEVQSALRPAPVDRGPFAV